MKLKAAFYLREDVVQIAQDLLGKYLMTQINGVISGGKIMETEAYAGISDKASHAYGGKRTNRTEIMFGKGGYSYVYLCYGIHHFFNVVTNRVEVPHAVLIRAILPADNISEILKRTQKKTLSGISDGPGKLTKALGINMDFNKLDLMGNDVWIEDRGEVINVDQVIVSPRIGVGYAGDDAKRPYRFNLIQ